jgi:hypothetical protein
MDALEEFFFIKRIKNKNLDNINKAKIYENK